MGISFLYIIIKSIVSLRADRYNTAAADTLYTYENRNGSTSMRSLGSVVNIFYSEITHFSRRI